MDRKEKTWRRDPFLLSTLALVLLLMGLIFYFSSQTEEQSGDSSGAIVSFLISRLYADYDQLPPTHRAELLPDLLDFHSRGSQRKSCEDDRDENSGVCTQIIGQGQPSEAVGAECQRQHTRNQGRWYEE